MPVAGLFPSVPAARVRTPPVSGHAYMKDLIETSLLAAVVGAITGLIAVGVRVAISFLTGVFFRGDFEVSLVTRSPGENSLGFWLVLVPAVGAALAYLILRIFSKDRRIRGASEIVRSVAHRRGTVSTRSIYAHAAANMVSVGSGGSAGREGIMVQLGAGVGSLAARAYGTSVRHRKILLAAGGAAAISATFNTPIAGVIFAAEVILIEWSTRSFIPLTVASAMGVLVATNFLGDEPTFPIPAYELVSASELLLYVLLGVLCGLLAIATLRLLSYSDDVFGRIKLPDWVAPVVGGLLVGGIALFVPEVLGVGYETVAGLLSGEFVQDTGTLVLILLAAKLFAFAITRGSGGASGAFSPSLFLGAALGAAFGVAVHSLFPLSTGPPAAYALVGMAAVFAAVTRASLTAVVMLYEMTHTFSIVIPVMLAVVVADALAKAYGTGSYYARGQASLPMETDASVNVLDMVPVAEIMTADVETVPADGPVRQVVEKRLTTGHQGFPVVDVRGRLVGIITATDMRQKVKEGMLDQPIRDFMTPAPSVIGANMTAHQALTMMVSLDIGHLPVVDDVDSRQLVGFLTRTDLFRVERRTLDEENPEASFLPPIRPFRRDADP